MISCTSFFSRHLEASGEELPVDGNGFVGGSDDVVVVASLFVDVFVDVEACASAKS